MKLPPITKEQFNRIRFRCTEHLSMVDGHSMISESVDFLPKIDRCDYVPYKDGGPQGIPTTHYCINGKVFKTKAKAIEYINKLRGHQQ